jgi:hypothetical protein
MEQPDRRIGTSHHPHGARRHVPSSSEEGDLSAILEFRDIKELPGRGSRG